MIGTRNYNLKQSYHFTERVSLYAPYTAKLQSVLFDGIRKGVFDSAKFDSQPELQFARVLESDTDVLNWLRPAPQEFNITYNHGHSYEPDFVVETENMIYLIEIKGEDKLNDPDVIAKKKRDIQISGTVKSPIVSFSQPSRNIFPCAFLMAPPARRCLFSSLCRDVFSGNFA